jgi:outer membrane protein assembly factor BamB
MRRNLSGALIAITITIGLSPGFAAERGSTDKFDELVSGVASGRGLYVHLGATRASEAIALAKSRQWLVYIECSRKEQVKALREMADKDGLLGRRVFVARSAGATIQLADDLADVVRDARNIQGANEGAARKEVLRILRPGGKVIRGSRTVVKPVANDVDYWSHPYHGPDNNPVARQRITAPSFRTQFLAEPRSGAVFRVTVAAGGRLFTAYGDASPCQWLMEEVTSKLWAMNAHNGTCLWTRKLKPGFWVQRNTLVATSDVVYLGDDVSCKALDAATGALRYELTAPLGKDSDRVWKWMGLSDGVMYGLLGGREVKVNPGMITLRRSAGFSTKQHQERAWGVGRTLVAINLKTRKVLWHRREEMLVDTRGVCMRRDRIYFHSPGKYLSCVNAATGKLIWRTSDPKLMDQADREGGRGTYGLLQPQPYLMCNDRSLVFTHRRRPFAVSTEDGKLLDTKIVLPPGQGCARVNAAKNTYFSRHPYGTACRDSNWKRGQYTITAMRPHCETGVVPSNGLLYWTPWNCHGCLQSLAGNICLRPVVAAVGTEAAEQLQRAAPETKRPVPVPALVPKASDWPTYLRDNKHSATTSVKIPGKIGVTWTAKLSRSGPVTAPVTVGDLVFVGGSNGAVYCLDATDGSTRWKAYTGGEVFFPPVIWSGRAYVGSCDGHVYAYEALTGRLLWRFRAAPQVRRIPAYGRLTSTWPVSGGVLVQDGVLYAAAGITDYDAVHVYALDAKTGKLKWHTDCADRQLCLAGALGWGDGFLRFSAGNVHPEAQFDPQTGRIRTLRKGPSRMGYNAPPTRRYRLFPRKRWGSEWGQISDFQRDTEWGRVAILTGPEALRRGLDLAKEAKKAGLRVPGKPGRTPMSQGVRFFYGPQWTGVVLFKPQARSAGKPSRDVVWFKMPLSASTAAVIADGKLVLAGYNVDTSEKWNTTSKNQPTSFALKVLRVDTGTEIFSHALPAMPVPRGMAVDRRGRILVSLEDGRLLCYGTHARRGSLKRPPR